MLKEGATKVVQQDRGLFFSSKFVVSKKDCRCSPVIKFEKSQSLHSLLLFQNRRVIPVEKNNTTGRSLHVQNRP